MDALMLYSPRTREIRLPRSSKQYIKSALVTDYGWQQRMLDHARCVVLPEPLVTDGAYEVWHRHRD